MALSFQKSAVASGARTNAVSASRRCVVSRPVAAAAQRFDGEAGHSGLVAGIAAAMLLGSSVQPAIAQIMPTYEVAFAPSDAMLEDFSKKSGSTDPFQKGTDLSALPGKALVQATREVQGAGMPSTQVPDISKQGGAANLPGVPKLNPVKNPESKNVFQGFFKKTARNVEKAVNDPVDNIKSAVNKGGDNIKSAVNQGSRNVKSAVGNDPISNVKSAVNKQGDKVKSAVSNDPISNIKSAVNKAGDNVKSAVGNDPISNVKSVVNKQGDNVKAAVSNDPISNIKSAVNKGTDSIKSTLGQ